MKSMRVLLTMLMCFALVLAAVGCGQGAEVEPPDSPEVQDAPMTPPPPSGPPPVEGTGTDEETAM